MTYRPTKIRMDVWGGENSMDHLARQHFDPADPMFVQAIQAELLGDYLVNLRRVGPDEGWGPDQTFDSRIGGRA